MINVAILTNNLNYYNNNIFVNKNSGDKHLINFFKLLKREGKKNNIKINTIDYYNNDELDYYLFLDFPKNPYFKLTNRKKLIANYKRSINILKNLKNYNKNILYIWESPLINKKNWDKNNHKYFNNILTYTPNQLNNDKYHRFYYSVCDNIDSVELDFNVTKENFENKKLSCMITSNKSIRDINSGYALRYKIVNFFENKFGFDLYGFGWDKNIKFLDLFRKIKYNKKYLFNTPNNYKGKVESKINTYSNYKFAFAIENALNQKGYVTEKLFDVLFSSAIPIYNGENIYDDIIPENVYIDINDFSSLRELYNYINDMKYEKFKFFINQKFNFLNSEIFKLFTHEYNINKMIDLFKNYYKD
jgi:hypothetical protein